MNKWVSKPNPIHGRKPIMPLYKGIRMNSDSTEIKQCETVQSHNGRKCMKKQDKVKAVEMHEEETRQNQRQQKYMKEKQDKIKGRGKRVKRKLDEIKSRRNA